MGVPKRMTMDGWWAKFPCMYCGLPIKDHVYKHRYHIRCRNRAASLDNSHSHTPKNTLVRDGRRPGQAAIPAVRQEAHKL